MDTDYDRPRAAVLRSLPSRAGKTRMIERAGTAIALATVLIGAACRTASEPMITPAEHIVGTWTLDRWEGFPVPNETVTSGRLQFSPAGRFTKTLALAGLAPRVREGRYLMSGDAATLDFDNSPDRHRVTLFREQGEWLGIMTYWWGAPCDPSDIACSPPRREDYRKAP